MNQLPVPRRRFPYLLVLETAMFTRRFVTAYLLLLMISVIGIGQRNTQMIITTLWIIVFLPATRPSWPFKRRFRGARNYPPRFVRSLSSPLIPIVSFFISQIPGIVAAGCSLWSAFHGSMNEWANGMLEIWVSPFLPFLERLPAHSVYHFSETYIAACLTPLVLVVVVSGLLSLGCVGGLSTNNGYT